LSFIIIIIINRHFKTQIITAIKARAVTVTQTMTP